MKARCSPTTAKDMLNPMQQKAVLQYVEDIWRKRQKMIIKRYLAATCLALNDLYQFGDKRLYFTLNGIGDILDDYAGKSFTPTEGRTGSLEDGDFDPMLGAMLKELASRKQIHIEIGEFVK